jgi:hypothetical protein
MPETALRAIGSGTKLAFKHGHVTTITIQHGVSNSPNVYYLDPGIFPLHDGHNHASDNAEITTLLLHMLPLLKS